ncbi:hypothetical protein T492DRAFT_1059114 [Pavlovales sp. CCMP2436]|nr:hypothetical protein T492DRAFT_1059114 [Pavlovales sp. CCMP2436]
MEGEGAEQKLAEAREQIDVLQAELVELRLQRGPAGPLSIALPPLGMGGGSDGDAQPVRSAFGDYALGLGLPPQRRAINVVIPMSGLKDGPFAHAGYRFPKPLINVVGRPVLHWVLEALVLAPDDTVWLPISDELELAHGVMRHVQRAFPQMKVHIVRLTVETAGWCETMAATVRQMPLELRGRRTLCVDCHTIAHGVDVVSEFRALPDGAGASFYCSLGDEPPMRAGGGGAEAAPPGDADSTYPAAAVHSRRFSYVQLSAEGSLIKEVREKVAISSNINIGAYGFPSAEVLLANSEALLDTNLLLLRSDPCANTTYHASALISKMIGDGVAFHAKRVDDSAFATVGSPEELLGFIKLVSSVPVALEPHLDGTTPAPQSPAASLAHGASQMHFLTSTRRLRFCFDLDSTLLCWDSAAHALLPLTDNIELVIALKSAHHYIILQTAASMDAGRDPRATGNVGRAVARAGPMIFEALKKHNIPFDELHFGKPAADFYIDSVTLNAGAGTLAKDIGWRTTQDLRTIEGGIRARSFNQIALVGEQHIIKSSNRKQIAGEAYYYAHIPPTLARHFPELVEVVDRPEVDTTSIVQTRVHGATYSHMLINLTLTVGRLRLLLEALLALHCMPQGVAGEAQAGSPELCANYARKLSARFHKHKQLYESFKPTAERDIRLLTAAHFFSIVPLHEEREHQERYLRASESMLVVEGLL